MGASSHNNRNRWC